MRLSANVALPLLLAWLALPAALMAQSATMRVRITDLSGSGVPHVLITLRDEGGQNTVSEQMTNDQGEATFEGLPVTAVRLSVSGQTVSGKPIVLGEVSFLDDDAMLVRTDVGGPDVPLVMDKDGYIYLAPEAIAPDTSEAEAPVVTTLAPTADVATSVPSIAVGTVVTEQTPRSPLWMLLLIGGLLTAVAVACMERRVP